MSRNLWITVSLLCVIALAGASLLFLSGRGDAPPGQGGAASGTPAPAPAELLVREDSHHLTRSEGAEVTVVEFLDFECEACRAQFPVMERVREDYEGRINLVVRYFPLPGHANSRPAAAAVEAAAQQGAFEEMYVRMYETQAAWGESQESQIRVFLGFAEELDLDMAEFTRTMAAPETAERVQADFDDGVALGVQGTPTIYVNGRQTESMPGYEALSALIDAELGE
ncbi:thioredoxin domain-containing protein [Nocardiopsis sp. CT-R113]|uniref:Thioredoxin domain-containing protein n=1 Tax=Nocardiopsis codii TaxID=3065942 RepID=A0ABU7K4R6_9ACTN|nr:thioredoxin domain-containing protein [Nocardiopsis sp. CT-R113]MEE2036839.1 thioredoxin domain-containing protein [Nocardiopsis sp. CT-R113]